MSEHPDLVGLLERCEEPEIQDHLATCPVCRARARALSDLPEPEALGLEGAALGAVEGLQQARERMAEGRRRAAALLSRSLEGRLGGRPRPELQPGQRIDRYVVEERLAHGGMGTVYRVRHRKLQSAHALKVLHTSGASLARRLVREGRAQGELAHPNIVRVTDVVEIDGELGLIMELVEGPSLAAYLAERGPLPLELVDRLGQQILSGVAAAHQAGLVHRDLKPANVLLASGPDGLVAKVTDFGLARRLDDPEGANLTHPSAPMGTPAYMSPEQIRDARVADARSDVFSLGATLYELATGRQAFAGFDVADIYDRVRAGRYTSLSSLAPHLPSRIWATVRRALRVDPCARFADGGAMLEAWRGEVVAEPRDPRRWGLASAAVAVVAIAVLVVGWRQLAPRVPPGEPPSLPAAASTGDDRLTAVPRRYQIFAFAVSPDGASLAWCDSRGLWLQADGMPALVLEGAHQNVDFFPDGQRLMIATEGIGIRSVRLDGSDLQHHLDLVGRFVRLSPDGRTVAVSATSGLWVADLQTRERRRLRPLAGRDWTVGLAWSPSGDAIAAIHQTGKSTAWLEVTAADGSWTRRLLDDPQLVSLGIAPIAWLPGDRLLYALSERPRRGSPAVSLYAVDGLLDPHTPSPEPRLIRRWSGFNVTQMRSSADGHRLVYQRVSGAERVYVLPLADPAARWRLSQEDWEEFPLTWWSEDALLVRSERAGGGLDLRRIDGDPVRVMSYGGGFGARIDDALIHWRFDGSGAAKQYVLSRTQLEPTPGASRDLVRFSDKGVHGIQCSGARSACLIAQPRDEALELRWVSAVTGEIGDVVFRIPITSRHLAWDLSSDGSRIAVATGPGVLVVHDLDSGEEIRRQNIPVVQPWHLAFGPAQRPDEAQIYVSGLNEALADPYWVVAIDPQGRAQRLWSSASSFLYAPRASPDGAHLAVGALVFDDDLWAMQDSLVRDVRL